MEDNIFDISFAHGGITYKGWVNPSEKLNEDGKPVSFHVVLNETSFGYMSYQSGHWSINEERPEGLVELVGEKIEEYYSSQESKQN